MVSGTQSPSPPGFTQKPQLPSPAHRSNLDGNFVQRAWTNGQEYREQSSNFAYSTHLPEGYQWVIQVMHQACCNYTIVGPTLVSQLMYVLNFEEHPRISTRNHIS